MNTDSESLDAIRVYLDHAILADAADGTPPWDDLDALLGTMQEHSAVLVISLGHIIDLHRADDPATKEATVGVVERFDRVVGVAEDVLIDERAAHRSSDEGAIWPLTDLHLVDVQDPRRELLDTPGGEHVARVVEKAHAANEAARAAGGATKHAQALFERAIRALASGRDELNLRDLFGNEVDAMPEDTRAQVESYLAQVAPILGQIGAKFASVVEQRDIRSSTFAKQLAKRPEAAEFEWDWFDVRGKHEAWLERVRERAPGNYLAWLLRRHQGQRGRQLDEGDRADRLHASVLPYVDIATLDRENHGVVKTHWNRIAKRTTALIPNGHATPDFVAKRVREIAQRDS